MALRRLSCSSWRASEASRSALEAMACHDVFKPPQQGDVGRSKVEWRPDELAKNLGCGAVGNGFRHSGAW